MKPIIQAQFTKSIWTLKIGIFLEKHIIVLGGFYFAHTEPIQRFEKKKYWYFEIYPPQMIEHGTQMFTIGFNTDPISDNIFKRAKRIFILTKHMIKEEYGKEKR